MEGHGGIFILMPLLLLLAFLPFIGFVVQAFAQWFRLRRDHSALALCGSAAVFVTIFFSFSSTKLPSYISPALPFAAVLIGFYLNEIASSTKKLKWPWLISLAHGIALVAGGYVGILNDESIGHMPWLAFLFLPLVLGAGASFYFAGRQQNQKAIIASVTGSVLTILLIQTIGFPLADAQNPVYMSKEIVQGKSVVAYKRFNSAFVFTQPSTVLVIHDPANLEAYMKLHPDHLVLSTHKHLDELKVIEGLDVVFYQKDLFENPRTVILSYKSD